MIDQVRGFLSYCGVCEQERSKKKKKDKKHKKDKHHKDKKHKVRRPPCGHGSIADNHLFSTM